MLIDIERALLFVFNINAFYMLKDI